MNLVVDIPVSWIFAMKHDRNGYFGAEKLQPPLTGTLSLI